MDSTNSTFVNDTMDSIGDSILASPKDIGEGDRGKALGQVGKEALQDGVEHASHTVRAKLEMTSETVNQEVLGDTTEAKSLTDLNDNQFVDNLKTSVVQNVDEVREDVATEAKSLDALHINTVNNTREPQQLLNDAENKASEEFGQLKSSTIEEARGVQSGLSEIAEDADASMNVSQTEDDAGKKGELLDTVKKAGMTAVADVQAGATVEDAAKKAVTEVVTNVSPDISSSLSAGLASFRSSGGSPEPTKSFSSTTTTTTTQKVEPRVTFSDTLDTTSKVTSPTSKTTPISVLVTDANKTTTNITQGVAALRRQPSTESRDNPFIPDGELSKETDELLKRATIIRDKFYLDQQERERKGLAGEPLDSTDHGDTEKSPIRESAIAPVSAQPANSQLKGSQPATAEVKPRMRENGKLEDSVSPEGIKPEVEKGAAAPIADGSKLSPETSGENEKDKKKQKKCCSIM